MGGMISWLYMVLDNRVHLSAPIIGVQGFKWAIDNERYHARVNSIPKVCL